MLPLVRAAVLAACFLPLALPASASAALSLSHVQAQAVEIEGSDDVVTPGDVISVDETIATATALTNATGTLLSPTPGVTPAPGSSVYPDAPAGGQSKNRTPFRATVADSVPCGSLLQFTLSMSADGGFGSTSFAVGTGAEGPGVDYDSAAPPQSLADADLQPGVTNLELGLFQTGRVKTMKVKVGSLSHPRLSDLRLALVAPEGQEIVLAEAGELNGTTMTNTVFAAGASTPITSGSGTYSSPEGYAPTGDLAAFEGRLLNGTWTLKVTDTVVGESGTVSAWGLNASRAFCEGIPKARFTMTPPETVPGGTIQFNASASSDGNGQIAAYAWDLDGDGEYDDGTTPQVQRTYPVKAKVPVRLRVTDNDGLTDIEHQDLPVTIKPVAAITASPTNPAPLTGETVRLSAAGSTDADGTIARYEWDVDDKDSVEDFVIDTEGTNYADVTYAKAGTYTATVRVTDDSGSRDTETVQVVVRNRPPVAVIAQPGAVVVRDRPATISAAGSTDPEGAQLTYEWNFDGDTTYEVQSGTSETVQHTFTSAGDVTVGVRVSDGASTATATRLIHVTRAPVVPVTATPNPVSLRDDVALDASGAHDPDDTGSPLTYEWDLDGDAVDDYAAPGAATQVTSWSDPGTYTVKVRVTAEDGVATVGTVPVVVRNMLPVGAISANPAAPKAGEVVQLSAAGSSDPDGVVKRYQWDLDGDGSYTDRDTGTTPSTSTTFANHGNVTVGVRVTDDDGGTATKTLTIAVARADEVPDGGGATGGGTDGGSSTPVQPAAQPDGADDGQVTPPPPPAETPGDAPPPVVNPERPFGAWVGGAAMQRTRQVLARGVLLSCRSEVAAWCSFKVSVAARDAKRLKLGRRAAVVAKSALPVPEGRSARKRVRLNAKARRALRGADGLRLLVRAIARSGDGREVALTRVVLLRR